MTESRFNLVEKRRCSICDSEFVPNRIKQKYCSGKCRNIAWKIYMKRYMARKRLLAMLKNGMTLDEAKELINEIERNVGGNWTDEMTKKIVKLAKEQQFVKEAEIKKTKCCICKSKEKLVIHHIRYFPKPKTVVLCQSCHMLLHRTLLKGKKCRPNWFR